jgi:hypothetical protein
LEFKLTGVNFIAMAAITAATIATELAAGKIDADIEETTKTYLEDLKRSKWLFLSHEAFETKHYILPIYTSR